MAQQVIAIMYQIYGGVIRDLLMKESQQLEIRANIIDAVMQRLNEIDGQNGG